MLFAPLVLVGGISTYHVGDGHNAGTMACGGPLRDEAMTIAIRQWRGRCGARALVCSEQTLRCVRVRVMDAGPFGAVRDGKWEVQIRLKPGWRRRGVVDVTRAVHRALGKPRFLSRVVVVVEKQGGKR